MRLFVTILVFAVCIWLVGIRADRVQAVRETGTPPKGLSRGLGGARVGQALPVSLTARECRP